MTERQAMAWVVACALMWSTGGVLSRFFHTTEGFDVTFWRSVFAALTVLVWLAVRGERAQQERRDRAAQIVENLRELGFDLTLEDAIREAGDADAIGRPHIAKAAGATGDLGPFFEEYLVPGAKAFVARTWPSPYQACQLIREAGGVPVIAHPYWDIKDPNEVEKLIRSLDLGGIEVFYPSHDEKQTAHLLALARELGIAATASSDFHGPTHRTFSRFGAYDTFGLGEPEVPARPAN